MSTEILTHAAGLLAALIVGKKIRHRRNDQDKWRTFNTDEARFAIGAFLRQEDFAGELRIVPDMIIVNGNEVPAPIKTTDTLEPDMTIYWPCFSTGRMFTEGLLGREAAELAIAFGVAHKNAFHAVEHAKAMMARTPTT